MVKIVTWNVKGLRSPHKRLMVLRHLKKLHADIALLQEMHLGAIDFRRMKKLWVGEVIGSPSDGKKASVLILLHKRLHYKILTTDTDDSGRLATLTIETPAGKLSIYNVYAPNVQAGPFIGKLERLILQDSNNLVLIGGDLNMVHSVSEDRKRTRIGRADRQEESSILPTMLEATKLTDIWRHYS
ncbi:exodeoxyribonuclease-like [Bufo bufo]|uniref:exodeoxyribonuclease-like n=1 Tax=Bufo bufo TaxID=8384 RepID=UPI001ABDB6EF|nr:exodeoxyribonuclease-like [Bufo bufo]